MFSVSAGYKTAVEESGRITKTTIVYDDVTVTSEDVLSYFKYSHELPMDSVSGYVGKFPTAKVNYRIIAKQPGYDFVSANRSITVTASIKVGLTYEDVLLGTFIVTNEVIDKAKDEIIIEALDSSILFDKKYALTPTFPMTVKDWVLAICAEVGVVLGSTSWLNSTLVLNAEPMVEGSYRNAIQYVAEACGQFARIGRDNKLYFIGFTSSGRTINEVFEYKVSDVYGPVNSLALTRDPTNDDIIEVNQPSIDLFGETRVKVDNNPILDGDRSGLIGPLFDVLDGFEMNVASLEYPGDPSFDIGDELLFIDDNSVTQTLKVTSVMFEHTGSWSGSLMAVAPSKADIDSDYSGDVSKKIRTTEIKVNKLTGEIQIIGNQVDIITGDYYDGILEGAKYTFDGTMATFLGGGLKIKNNASVDVFYADVDGNLVLKGTLNAGAVIGSTITGSDIIGGTLKTSDTGDRIEISGNRLVSIKSGIDVVSVDLDGITFYDSFDNVGAGVRYTYDALKLGSRYAFTEPRMDWSTFMELGDGGMTLESSQDWVSGIFNRLTFYAGSSGDYFIDLRASDDTNVAAIELHPTTRMVNVIGTLNLSGNLASDGMVNQSVGSALKQTNVGSFYTGNFTNTGVIIIDLGTRNFMFDAEISVYSYKYRGKIRISGYTYIGGTGWFYPTASGNFDLGTTPLGALPINVRFAGDGLNGKRYIMIGNTDTVWEGYLSVVIDHVNSGFGSGLLEPVTITLATSYAGTTSYTFPIGKAWTSENDGSGSTLDADLLDGQHASAFQPTLVSGTNIKTINGTSILGSGDLVISATVDWSQVFDDSSTYRQYMAKGGSPTGYMRTPSNGLIPSSNGSGGVGTATWRFASMYADAMYLGSGLMEVLAIAGEETTNPRTLKLSDGTIIKSGSSAQTAAITAAYGGGFYVSSTITITFDTSYPFTVAPSVSVFPVGAVDVSFLVVSVSTTNFVIKLFKYGSTASASYTIYYNAIGR